MKLLCLKTVDGYFTKGKEYKIKGEVEYKKYFYSNDLDVYDDNGNVTTVVEVKGTFSEYITKADWYMNKEFKEHFRFID